MPWQKDPALWLMGIRRVQPGITQPQGGLQRNGKMSAYARPKVVVSKCLGFDACRWNGEMVSDRFVDKLAEFVDFKTVCPETAIGLGVPRDPVRLVDTDDGVRLMQPASKKDCTRKMATFCDKFLGSLKEVDGFLLKGRSPSCGPVDVRIYKGIEKGAASRRGPGFFGREVAKTFPMLAVEHEGRVHNFSIREHFLVKLFVLAEFRALNQKPSVAGLNRFQARHKLLLMAYNQSELHRMGRISANLERRPLEQVFADYGLGLARALARAPKFTSNINVLMHAMGYFKKELSTLEKAHFLDILEHYRAGKAPLHSLQALLGSWTARFNTEYLREQSYFAPYPMELFEITDSGKGRNY
jgi:uncharacterized protein YbgA (DUF1722 family)/uncharacterized protein YbbK (DUF523 family)